LYSIEYCIILLPVDLLAHPALGQHWKEIILHFWRMGSAVIEEERAMHPAYLYALSEYSILYKNSYKVYKESVSILLLKI
jgi:hypothetical protein